MSGIILQFTLLAVCVTAIVVPHLAILLYYWLTWLNPHRFFYGGFDIRIIYISAAFATIGWLISRERKIPPINVLTVLLGIFFLLTTISTVTSQFPTAAWDRYYEWINKLAMAAIAMCVINTRIRLHCFVWAAVIAIGYFGVDGGLFTILSRSATRYYVGPERTAIYNSNEIARAFLMAIPFMYYLAIQSKQRIVRYGMLGITFMTVLGILATTSRTVFVAVLLIGVVWWLRSNRKLLLATIGLAAAAVAFVVVPEERLYATIEKYESIQNYETDVSFQGRVENWETIVNLASRHPLTGGGFDSVVKTTGLAPHSIYFEVLGEHGYLAFVTFILMLISALWYANQIYHRTKGIKGMAWARDLAFMIQISLIGYAFAGITKNHAFFEFLYMEIAMLVCLRQIVGQTMAESAVEPRRTATAHAGSPARTTLTT